MSVNEYFYSGQIRRFITQFIRIVSGFQVQYGFDPAGHVTLQRVPVYYGAGSRQVAQILTNNSENTLPTVPAMAVYISELRYDRERLQDPTFVGKLQVRQRYFNPVTNQYDGPLQGNAHTIERLMPVPYKLGLKLDIWTSSNDQKLQLLEQLAVLFNPSMEIQNTDNYVDWSSLTWVTLTDVNHSSRSIPVGTEETIDVATLTFEIPIWITPPAKVIKMGVIQKIIASIFDDNGNIDEAIYNDSNLLSRQYFTPLNYDVLYVGNELTLLNRGDIVMEPNGESSIPEKVGTPDKWINLINIYGVITPGLSQVHLTMHDGNELVGTIAFHPTDDTKLLFNVDVDTLPTNTLDPIDAIIDPEKATINSDILNPVAGTRYLLLNSIGAPGNTSGPIAWKGAGNQDLIANANDIIEYNGSVWSVVFDSVSVSTTQYVINLTTNIQYKWKNSEWTRAYIGAYVGGSWSLII